MPATATAAMIRREIEAGICVLTFDRPDSGANIFDAATMKDLSEHLSFIENESSLKGLIITSAKKSIFIAGADLATLLRQAVTGEMRAFIAEGQRVFNRLAALKIPTCAAIHGACAGGGYEVTLACDDRVASNDPSTKIGLPETTLGLVPAWGGATRLPRLIGPKKASEVILKGKLYSAAEAKELGLVDEVVPREQLLEAAHAKIRDGKKRPSPSPLPEGEADAQPPVRVNRERSKTAGNAAPAKAQEIISKTLRSSIDDSLRMELDAIVELGETESTRNLIRNFFLADKYKKGSAKTAGRKNCARRRDRRRRDGLRHCAMAQLARRLRYFARCKFAKLIDRGLANIEKTYADAVKRGLMSEEKAKQGRARIVASTAPVEMRDVQIVIEAASEKLEIKKQIFARSRDENRHRMQFSPQILPRFRLRNSPRQRTRPSRVIGLHFFNPVSRMKLIEVVVGKQTSRRKRRNARSLSPGRSESFPVVVRDSPGFLVNRVLFPYLLDAARAFRERREREEIDDALVEWGMPMGPLRLIDEIGVDITVDIADTLEKAYGERDRARRFCSDARCRKCSAAKPAAVFTNTKARRNRLTKRLRIDGVDAGNASGPGFERRRPISPIAPRFI